MRQEPRPIGHLSRRSIAEMVLAEIVRTNDPSRPRVFNHLSFKIKQDPNSIVIVTSDIPNYWTQVFAPCYDEESKSSLGLELESFAYVLLHLNNQDYFLWDDLLEARTEEERQKIIEEIN